MAYVIIGHGSEEMTRHIVPEGCMIVVDVHSGEINYDSKIPLFFDGSIDKEKFLNPIDNYAELVKKISNKKSLAIYREGDEYPDFTYHLISYSDMGSPDWGGEHRPNTYVIRKSGIVKYPFTDIDGVQGSVLPYKSGPEPFIENYNLSILPTMEELSDAVATHKVKSVQGIINAQYGVLKHLLVIKQSELFKRLEPGVFYNLVCRTTFPDVLEKSKETGRKVIKNSLRLINGRRDNMRASGRAPLLPRVILDHISEAQLQRIPFAHRATLKKNANTLKKNINTRTLEKFLLNQRKQIEEIEEHIRDTEIKLEDPRLADSMKKIFIESIELDKKLIAASERRIERFNNEEFRKKKRELDSRMSKRGLTWKKRGKKWYGE